MEITTETSTSGPLLYAAYVMCIVLYWPVFLAVRLGYSHFHPELSERLKREDYAKKYIPMVMMTVRGILGVGLTLPACAIAAYTTPPGLNHPLNVAGQICVATQTTVWAVEIPWMLEYSMELFTHHIICLIITANLVLSPTIHQLKPIFLFFTSQLGDLGPSALAVTKQTGRRPDNSNLMYYITLASTFWIMFGKVGCTGTGIAIALENPYRIADWIWGFCLSFFVIYHTMAAWRNLRWIGVIKTDETNPYKRVFVKRFSVPVANMLLGLAFAVTVVSAIFVYSLYSPHTVKIDEVGSICLNCLIAAAIALTNAVKLRIGSDALYIRPGGYNKAFCLQYGLVWGAAYLCWAANGSKQIDGDTALAAGAFSIPILQTILGLANDISIKEDEHTRANTPRLRRGSRKGGTEELFWGCEHNEVDNQEPESPSSEDDIELEKSNLKQSTIPRGVRLVAGTQVDHFNAALSNLVIFLISVAALFSGHFDFQETAKMAGAASVLIQLQSLPFLKLLFDISTVIYLYRQSHSLGAVAIKGGLLQASLKIGTFLKGEPRQAPSHQVTEKKRDEERKRKPKSMMSHLMSPICFTFFAMGCVQAIMTWEVLRNPDFSKVEETRVGWKNFRTALTSPRTWITAMYMISMPIFGLGYSNFNTLLEE